MRRNIAMLMSIVMLLTACSGNTTIKTENNENTTFSNETDEQLDDTTEVTDIEVTDVMESKTNTESQPVKDISVDLSDVEDSVIDEISTETVDLPTYYSYDDPAYIQSIEDNMYSGLTDSLSNEDYVIENLEARYYSDEYLEHLAYNSKENIWFGYTRSELDEFFGDEKYVFTLAENGTTTVTSVQSNSWSVYEQAIKDVAVGTGVIVVCYTISIVSQEKSISGIFATAARNGLEMGVKNGLVAAVSSAIYAAGETHDMEQILETAISEGAYEYKWSAIEGVCKKLGIPVERSEKKEMPQWQLAIDRVIKKYGGEKSKSYSNGKEVSFYTLDAYRPDVVRTVDGKYEAIEVEYYNLLSKMSIDAMNSDIRKKVQLGCENLPDGYTQRIVLDVSGRGYSKELVNRISDEIKENVADIYDNIPVDVIGGGI